MPAPNAAALLRVERRRPGARATARRSSSPTGSGPTASSTPSPAASRGCSASGSRPTGRAHVAVLLDNTPDYLFAFGGAALIGAAIVGLNHTRRDEHLLRDADPHPLRPRDHRAAPRRAVTRPDRRRGSRRCSRSRRFADRGRPRPDRSAATSTTRSRPADDDRSRTRARRRHPSGR